MLPRSQRLRESAVRKDLRLLHQNRPTTRRFEIQRGDQGCSSYSEPIPTSCRPGMSEVKCGCCLGCRVALWLPK